MFLTKINNILNTNLPAACFHHNFLLFQTSDKLWGKPYNWESIPYNIALERDFVKKFLAIEVEEEYFVTVKVGKKLEEYFVVVEVEVFEEDFVVAIEEELEKLFAESYV